MTMTGLRFLVNSLNVCLLLVVPVESFQNTLRVKLTHDSALRQSRKNDDCETTLGYNPTRRDVLFQSASLALPSLLIGDPVYAAEGKPQSIVMTGANSGLGFEACKRLAKQGHSIVLACRSLAKAEDAIQRIRDAGISEGSLSPASCDLTSLDSIKSFADDLSLSNIDVLCLNAGIARNAGATDCVRTMDGFELTGTLAALYGCKASIYTLCFVYSHLV